MPKIALDADYLIFQLTEGKDAVDLFPGERGKKKLKPYKKKFKEEVTRLGEVIAANLPGEVGKIVPFFSDPYGNFRYDLYPEYKNNRKASQRSDTFYRLRKWAHKKYGYVKNTEADDVVAYYVREKKWIGASFDKDLLKGVPGIWFDVYHSREYIVKTSKEEAKRFALLQTLAGDSTDNIKGIPRVGLKTAENLLTANGADWNGVVQSYLNAGLTEEDAILNRRLIGMDQYNGKKIILFKGILS